MHNLIITIKVITVNKSTLLFAVLALSAVPLITSAQGAPPFAGKKAMTCEEALIQAPKDDAELTPLAKGLADASVKLKKSPKDANVKKAYVDSAFKYGDALMHLPQGKLTPPVQYRAALALFRKALAVDPKHKGSLAEKKAIDDIYSGMPGGIPK
jgi:hypothetical protein